METPWKIKIKKHNKCKVSSFLIMSNWEKYLKDIYLDNSCCDMSQNDTIGKIELIPFSVLSKNKTNC